MKIFGLDIGSTASKIVQLEKVGQQFRLLAAGLAPTPAPGFVSEAENDLIALATALKKLHQETKIATNKVVTALPEAEVMTRVIELPRMKENELAQAIPWEAEQFVPQPLAEMSLDWQIINQEEKGEGPMKVFLVASPKILIEKYLKVLNLAGFEVVGIETELIAAQRALVPSSGQPTMVIDFGAKSTDLAIIKNGQILFTRSIPTAGEAFTRAISTGLSLEIAQAEEYKRTYGLEEKQLEGKIKQALTPIFKIVADEVKRAIQAWQEKEKEPLSRLILAGGTANLPQASSLLASQLGLEVQIADPFATLLLEKPVMQNLKSNSCLFAVAVGLAQKEV